jgi:hypothetical protein
MRTDKQDFERSVCSGCHWVGRSAMKVRFFPNFKSWVPIAILRMNHVPSPFLNKNLSCKYLWLLVQNLIYGLSLWNSSAKALHKMGMSKFKITYWTPIVMQLIRAHYHLSSYRPSVFRRGIMTYGSSEICLQLYKIMVTVIQYIYNIV